MKKQQGYVLVIAMTVIAASMILVMSVLKKATAYSFFGRYAYDREKAKVLAYSGLQVACAQLAHASAEKEESKKMAAIIMLFDVAQTFTLRQEIDGIDGEIGVTIGSEQGKININALYDFKEKKFITEKGYDGKKIAQYVCEHLKNETKEKELFGALEQFLKKREKPLCDVTELNTVIVYKKGVNGAEKLRDIFTVSTPTPLIQPFFISSSIRSLCGLKKWPDEQEKKKKQIEEITKKLKQSYEWDKDWNVLLSSVYGKEYAGLAPELRTILDPKFGLDVIFVVSYGTYNGVTQRIYAIAEKDPSSQKDVPPVYHIRRMYWL